jgi:hypothetical protein
MKLLKVKQAVNQPCGEGAGFAPLARPHKSVRFPSGTPALRAVFVTPDIFEALQPRQEQPFQIFTSAENHGHTNYALEADVASCL